MDRKYLICPLCGGELMYSGAEMTQDLFPDYDDESMMSFFICSRCGRDIEITDPRKEDKIYYNDYWKIDETGINNKTDNVDRLESSDGKESILQQ